MLEEDSDHALFPALTLCFSLRRASVPPDDISPAAGTALELP